MYVHESWTQSEYDTPKIIAYREAQTFVLFLFLKVSKFQERTRANPARAPLVAFTHSFFEKKKA